MTPLAKASKSLELASADPEYGITSEFGLTHKNHKLSPEGACTTVIESVFNELVKTKADATVKVCIQLKNAVLLYTKKTGVTDDIKSRTVQATELLAVRIFGYSKENILTNALCLTDTITEQMSEQERISHIFRISIDYLSTPVLKLHFKTCPEKPFSHLLEPSGEEKFTTIDKELDWRLKHVIELADSKLFLENALARIDALPEKNLIHTLPLKPLKMMLNEATYLFGVKEITSKLDTAFRLINTHQAALTSQVFHSTGRENRIAIFPVPTVRTIEELSLQLQTLHVIKHIVAKGADVTAIRPLLVKIYNFQTRSTASNAYGNMLIDFLNINELLFNVYTLSEILEKQHATKLTATDSSPCTQRLQFYLTAGRILKQSLVSLTSPTKTTKSVVDCTKLFQAINSAIITVQPQTTSENETQRFESFYKTLLKPITHKTIPNRKIINLKLSTAANNIKKKYYITLNAIEGIFHLSEVDRTLVAIISKPSTPTEKRAPFFDPFTIPKTSSKEKRKTKNIATITTTKAATPVDLVTKAIASATITETSTKTEKKPSPTSSTLTTTIPKAATPFDYHHRVTRWFIHKSGSKKDPINCDKAYSAVGLTDDEVSYKRFQHTFAIEVDHFTKEYGITGTGTERLKKLGVDIQHQIPAEVTIKLPSGAKTIRGICNYSISKQCFHRHFTSSEYEQINREFTENGFWHIDYPGSPSEVISLGSSPSKSTPIQFDGSYVKYKNENIVVIEDPKNSATITLALTKI